LNFFMAASNSCRVTDVLNSNSYLLSSPSFEKSLLASKESPTIFTASSSRSIAKSE
jgi:hypothetical protein